MGWRNEQCRKICRIIDNYLANRPTERDSLIVAVQKAFDALEQPETNCSEIPNNWIPCSVRLPEDDTEVLVYLFENNKSPYIAWLSDGRWYTEYFEVEQEDEPVAWMPLPEPEPYQGVER